MRVGVIGIGKLGLPVALAIESRGHDVCVHDINPEVKTFLEQRKIPYREEGLQPLLDSHDLTWCDTVAEVVKRSDIVFVAIQTPHAPEYEGVTPMPEARADFDYTALKAGLTEVVEAHRALKSKAIVAVISTCLPGTFRREFRPLFGDDIPYAHTPQFIAMGTVLSDYLNPEFNLIGVDDPAAAVTLESFYATINDAPSVVTDITTAEGAKLSYNTWLTAKTVIANAWGEMCERLGMDFDAMFEAWSLSTKRLISPRYMKAGMSDSGGCHPRDNIAMSWLASEVDMSYNLWDALMTAREEYEGWHAEYIAWVAKEVDLPIVLLGRAFKPETDIETGSAAILLANILRMMGENFLHVNDMVPLTMPAVYFIATANKRYADYEFPPGSVVLDPFGIIRDQEGVQVRRIGRR